jgi:hypothetical protein
VLSLKGSTPTITIEGSALFWLDSRTLARVTENDGIQKLEAFSIDHAKHKLSSPALIGELPKGASADNFQYSLDGGILVFSAPVFSDYDLSTVAEQDKTYEERGTSAYVFDDTFVRHWDTWRGPKKSRLFSVTLEGQGHQWVLGTEYFRPLLDTDHVRLPGCKGINQTLIQLSIVHPSGAFWWR